MITPNFSLTATERVLPRLALNFTTGVLDPRITFARAGATATRTNSSGYIETVAADTARFDFNPVTLECRGLLVEESRQNLMTYSEDFNTGFTTKTNVTVSAIAAANPANGATSDALLETTANGAHQITRGVTLTAASYTYSVYVKRNDRNFVFLGATVTTSVGAYFDLLNGTVGTVSAGFTASISPAANGFYRCSITFTATAASWTIVLGAAVANGTRLYTGLDAAAAIFVYGGQIELGSFTTSYIPTTTTAVTRNADVATITGTAFSGFWQSGPGSILVRALPSTVSGTRPLAQVDDTTADNIIALRGNTTNPELYIRAGGADQATIDAGTISAAAYRLAGAWQAGSAAASLNSGLAVNGAPASIPAATQMRLGSDGTNCLNGHLQAVQYWPLRLSNASLQNASSTAGYQSIIHPVSRDTIITEPV
jgi:hypothetical protein